MKSQATSESLAPRVPSEKEIKASRRHAKWAQDAQASAARKDFVGRTRAAFKTPRISAEQFKSICAEHTALFKHPLTLMRARIGFGLRMPAVRALSLSSAASRLAW